VVFSENDHVIGGFDPDGADRALGRHDEVFAMVENHRQH
jgi:hypothetical protein